MDLREDLTPELSREELALSFEDILATAIRLVSQMPDDQLENELPNGPRSWRVLMHHVFQIPNAFLDMEEKMLSSIILKTYMKVFLKTSNTE